MSAVIRREVDRAGANGPDCSSLLNLLKGAHDQILREMSTMDAIAGAAAPDQSIAAARWRLSLASLRRRSLAAQIIDILWMRVEGEELEQLKQIRAADQQLQSRSATHVLKWSAKAIGDDWPGYCEASRGIRAQMDAHISLEQAKLVPLLEGAARRGL